LIVCMSVCLAIVMIGPEPGCAKFKISSQPVSSRKNSIRNLRNDCMAMCALTIETATLDWVQRAVLDLNLCPFAHAVVRQKHLTVYVEPASEVEAVLHCLAARADRLMRESCDATELIVFPNGFDDFADYLHLTNLAEQLLDSLEYAGVLQLATFHPHYQFEGSEKADAANYTNRSPYPMLHLLQESAVEKAVAQHPNVASIPERNVSLLRTKTSVELEQLLSGEVQDT